MKNIFFLGFTALAATVLFANSTGSLAQQAPASAAQRSNPLAGQREAERAGAKLYHRECAACHREDASGMGKAPPLVSPTIENASPGVLFWVLRNGAVRRGMPSFSHMPELQRWQIVTYLNSLQPATRHH